MDHGHGIVSAQHAAQRVCEARCLLRRIIALEVDEGAEAVDAADALGGVGARHGLRADAVDDMSVNLGELAWCGGVWRCQRWMECGGGAPRCAVSKLRRSSWAAL